LLNHPILLATMATGNESIGIEFIGTLVMGN
jgi:hypothetical protein